MKQVTFLILTISLLSSCITKQNIYMIDLDFIYNSILENHPGVYNKQDPNFRKNLEKIYIESKTKITAVKTSHDLQKAINQFAKSFDDRHLWVHWANNTPKKQRDGITKSFSISRLSKNVTWINLPTFDLNINQEQNFKELIKNISTLQTEKYIIFDLRGNQGGNSDYGSQIINTLFGKNYADQKRTLHNQNVYVDWRASQGNLNHISSLLARHPSNHWLQNIKHGLQKSLAQNNIFYKEYSSEVYEAKENIISRPEFSFQIIVIIESVNVSAALDFIDELKMMIPNVILIGQETRADRLYMEVRSIPLRSGSGNFFFPIKVYRNRPRLDNESYVPNIEFNYIHHTASLQSFILEKIQMEEL
jgi:hypothetical protein